MGGIALYSFYNEETIANDLTSSLNYYKVDKDVEKFWDVINNDVSILILLFINKIKTEEYYCLVELLWSSKL